MYVLPRNEIWRTPACGRDVLHVFGRVSVSCATITKVLIVVSHFSDSP
jgi:hypothetical protein